MFHLLTSSCSWLSAESFMNLSEMPYDGGINLYVIAKLLRSSWIRRQFALLVDKKCANCFSELRLSRPRQKLSPCINDAITRNAGAHKRTLINYALPPFHRTALPMPRFCYYRSVNQRRWSSLRSGQSVRKKINSTEVLITRFIFEKLPCSPICVMRGLHVMFRLA